jgi:hypothetical protein
MCRSAIRISRPQKGLKHRPNAMCLLIHVYSHRRCAGYQCLDRPDEVIPMATRKTTPPRPGCVAAGVAAAGVLLGSAKLARARRTWSILPWIIIL